MTRSAQGLPSDSVRGFDRRRLITWGGLAAAGAPLAGAGFGPGPAAAGSSGRGRIPPDARPGGAYDRYVAKLAAEGRFSGVVLLSYRGRTVLSRSHGMADKAERDPQPRGRRVQPPASPRR